MSFEEWMREVNLLCWRWWGMSIYDLPDMSFRDAFDDGLSPESFMLDELGSLDQLAEAIFS